MLKRSRARALLVVATASSLLVTSVTHAQASDPDRLGLDEDPQAPALEGARDAIDQSEAAQAEGAQPERPVEDVRPPLPRAPTAAEVRNLMDADPRFARPILRRAARTATDPAVRALSLLALARVDPSRATARICARSLRIDPAARVRRASGECLGRLPVEAAAGHTATLLAALDDEALDVRTMAGWALASVGDEAALAPVSARVNDPDPRVASLFYDYEQRLRARHGAPAVRVVDEKVVRGPRVVPPADALLPSRESVETTLATTWTALYGGMSGWLHGGFFPSAHGGPLADLASLSALGGAVAGAAAFGAYGFLRAKKLTLAHNLVQLGTFGTLAGYGAGLLSGTGPQAGINMSSYSLSGGLVGTGVALAINEAYEPTPGALALGLATGFGTGVSFGSLARSYGGSFEGLVGAGLFFGGVSGALTTVIAAPYEIGLWPILGATVGGLAVASVTGVVLGVVEGAQLFEATRNYTPGVGWAVAGGYALGACTGAALALLLPDELDPFLAGALRLRPPAITVLPDVVDARRTVTLASIGGTF